MTELLEHPLTTAEYSLRPSSSRKENQLWSYTRGKVNSQTSRRSTKDLARQMRQIGSAEIVQTNLNRIILQNSEQIVVLINTDNPDARTLESTNKTVAIIGIRQVLESRLGPSTADDLIREIEAYLDQSSKPRLPYTASRVMRSIVERARQLDVRGNTDIALDLLYDGVDGLLVDGKFDEVESFLESASPGDFSLDLLLGLLTVTLPARSKLAARSLFYKGVKNTLVERGEYQDGLLVGLQ